MKIKLASYLFRLALRCPQARSALAAVVFEEELRDREAARMSIRTHDMLNRLTALEEKSK